MGVKLRPYRNGGWEVDITLRLPNGKRCRERTKAPVRSKSGAMRWGEDRERHLVQHGPEPPKKEVPTLKDFAPTFLAQHSAANRHKPSGIASKETILKVHLLPLLGTQKLDAIKTDDVQRLKSALREKAPKTVNNVLTVLNVLLKKAIEWDVIESMPCAMKLLPIRATEASFHGFADYERLLEAGRAIDWRTYLIVLLGGEAGLRAGEMVALQWEDVDLQRSQLCVRWSDWRGELTAPKSGRIRYVPITGRVKRALEECRHGLSVRVLCKDDGSSLTRQGVWSRVRYAARRAGLPTGVHILRHTFCSRLAMRGAASKAIQELAGHQELSVTQRYMHLSPGAADSAIRLLESSTVPPRDGDIVETASERGVN